MRINLYAKMDVSLDAQKGRVVMMMSGEVRTTVTFPRAILERIDRVVTEGAAKNRNELLMMAVEKLLREIEERAIDAAFADMANDPDYQREALRLAAEFEGADWESLNTEDRA